MPRLIIRYIALLYPIYLVYMVLGIMLVCARYIRNLPEAAILYMAVPLAAKVLEYIGLLYILLYYYPLPGFYYPLINYSIRRF